MNKEQFDALPPAMQALAETAYRDGYAAAIDDVEAIRLRIGDSVFDKAFTNAKELIVLTMRGALK